MWIGVIFTLNGVDVLGLTPNIYIYDMSDNSLVINGSVMPEIGVGGYKYNFALYDGSKNYYWKIDGGASLPNRERYKRGFSGLAGAIPDAQAGVNGGLPTVNASNHIVGMQGIKNTLDSLNDLSAAQVNTEVDTALNDYDGPTKAEQDTAFTEIKGAGFDTGTDSLKSIRDRGDAAWSTAGSAPTVNQIVDGILDEGMSGHNTLGTLGNFVNIMKKISEGRWKIDTTTNQLVFYDSDNVTPLVTFNLLDENGVSTSVNPTERVPV